MRRVLLGVLVLAVVGVAGCGGGDGGGHDDVADAGADAMSVPPGCVQPSVRAGHLIVSGTVVDFATGAAVAGAEVQVSTAWDTLPDSFPDECPVLATLTTNGNGQFGPMTVSVGSPLEPPLILFMVTGAGIAPTTSDNRVNGCTAGTIECGNLGHTIAAPSAALAAAWRTALAQDGMPDAATRGLVLFEYRNPGGTPATSVVPSHFVNTMLVDLQAGTEVRFLDADRVTLAPAMTTATLASGVAVIGADTTDGVDQVAGARGADRWAQTGVLVPPGWFFLEDKQQSP